VPTSSAAAARWSRLAGALPAGTICTT
jgi:hypothetical protein